MYMCRDSTPDVATPLEGVPSPTGQGWPAPRGCPWPASPSALQDACWRRTWPKQAPPTPGFHAQVSITYAEALEQVLARGGWLGLLGRGLGTRLLTNGIQASMFTVMWKLGEGYLAGKGM